MEEVRRKTREDRVQETWGHISDIYEHRAFRAYGLSGVSQRDHALQAATLAVEAGYDDALVIASLLHDVGHMVHHLGDNPAADGTDDQHEILGARWLGQHFDVSVVMPVKLHVAAKRYLCAVEMEYFYKLSPDSVQSLRLQGGAMTREEVAAFEALPFAQSAVLLRRLDERAKQPGASVMPLASFRAHIERLVSNDGGPSVEA